MTPEKMIEKMNSYRKENNIFQKSIQQRSEKFQTTMYDGPPFASGAPHFGHGLTSTMKDTIGRYKTMKGHKVVRNRGRDCHGLPVEKYVEKLLGLDGKKDIEKLGEEKFVEACRSSVKNTNDERKWFIDSLGRWVDIDHAYFTMDLEFMESVLWIFQNLYSKNLVYKGFKIQGYCPSCATGLSNSEVNDGYKDKQDPTITIKLKAKGCSSEQLNDEFDRTANGERKTVKAIVKKDNKVLLLQTVFGSFILPGGGIEKGETPEQTLQREIKEELGVEAKIGNRIGAIKKIRMKDAQFSFSSFYEAELLGEPSNQEIEEHTHMVWAEIIDHENELGFALNIDGTVMDDAEELLKLFNDFTLYQTGIAQKLSELADENTPVNFLAWTTTPWTLPSNSFLAVGEKIKYALIFDLEAKEYYILAKDLLSKYYKKPEEYLLLRVLDGKFLHKMSYEPLFDFVSQSKIPDEHKSKLFQVLLADFVSTDAGTGVVHQAPAFGEDDFQAVCQVLPQDKSLEWLFLPVDDYGEFTDEVRDYKGIRVYDANKDIIKRLKEEGKLISQATMEHSYPHCRRCDTPLIYKAISSWFVKEHDIGQNTIANTEKINFVPQTVKNRFQDVLKSAPDRNVSRNRYRGAPLPIRESESDENQRVVLGSLEEIYQKTISGSQNITKNIFIRHGRTDYNDKLLADLIGVSNLNEKGKSQAEELKTDLTELNLKSENTVIVVSPLKRTFQTILPYLSTIYDAETIAQIEEKYAVISANYQKLFSEGKILKYFSDSNSEFSFELAPNLLVDYRVADFVIPQYQDKEFHCSRLREKATNENFGDGSESVDMVETRTNKYLEEINEKYKTKTIITISHADNIILMIKKFRNFDYRTQRDHFHPSNTSVRTHYRDNDRQTEVDLHKPYIDNYRFLEDGVKYKRIPEVLDCWFESGSMPYGQVNYKGEEDRVKKQKLIKYSDKNYPFGGFHLSKKIPYPSDYIIEGLDQTRGWFRTLHVLGNGIMDKNSFNNVVINGLVLAEDGKKMSKKLKNYPDPKYLFHKYGSDSYRLYLLASPAVKAEPVRFTEKGVEQVYKDFSSSLTNAYKFFETYAKVDKFKYTKPEIFFMRHAEATGSEENAALTENAEKSLKTTDFLQRVLRVNPDVIYCSPISRAKKTAEAAQQVLKKYTGKTVEIIEEKSFAIKQECTKPYQDLIENNAGKRVLIVAHNYTMREIWAKYYGKNEELLPKNGKKMIENLETSPLPSYEIKNDLDKWILAEMHDLIAKIETEMDQYFLDTSAKALLGFIDKLTNRYIRRSRRRFWANGMDADKSSAYHTLFEVLNSYFKLCAPFAPFISEYLRLELNKFKTQNSKSKNSVHLEFFPISSKHFVDQELLEEISLVRRIISLGLYIRSKNNIKIKQPLQKMELQVE